MEIKIKISGIIPKTSGQGKKYWYVNGTNPVDNVAYPQHLCFDEKIASCVVGQELTMDSMHKTNDGKDTYYLQFPRDKRDGGKSFGTKSGYDEVLRSTVSIHTMCLSYAKDQVLSNMQVIYPQMERVSPVVTIEEVNDKTNNEILRLYKILKDTILKDALGLVAATQAQAKAEQATEAKDQPAEQDKARKDVETKIKKYLFNLTTFGWVLPDNSYETLITRFSTIAEPKTAGKPDIMAITAMQFETVSARFERFTSSECEGKGKDCKYYRAKTGNQEHFCQWVGKCLFMENKDPRFKS